MVYIRALWPVNPPILHLTLRYAQYGRISIHRGLLGHEVGRDGVPFRVTVVGKGIVVGLCVDSKLPVLKLDVDHLLWLLFLTLLRVLSYQSRH